VQVTFEMTPWLGELVGRTELDLTLRAGATVGDALTELGTTVRDDARARLMVNGRLHPSVLVVVDGGVCRDRDARLPDGATIRLMLPTAGG